MNSKPLVSILMTAYNRQKFIAEAIESVLASTYTNFELIIVDDVSTDDTVKIAEKYATQDARISIYKNEQNLGDYKNRNKAASYAKGKYLQYVDSDDMLLKDGLQSTVENMEANPSADFGILRKEHSFGGNILLPGEGIRHHFFNTPFLQIGPGGTIIKRDFFERLGGYPVLYGPANDNYFNLLAATKGVILLLEKPFVYYRIHEGQEINNKDSYLYNGYRYLKDALTNIPMQLTEKQKKWIANKNKRRFSVNIIKYFFLSFNLNKTIFAIKKAGFGFGDFVKGIFH
jgi:glycosyltransferase involved in cell wall biosynthesis